MKTLPSIKEVISRRKHDYSANGLLEQIYHTQKMSSKERCHDQPSYSCIELKDWAFGQQKFWDLYNIWVDSIYYKWLKPSVDRIDDNKGYSFDNIQIVDWWTNHQKNTCKIYRKNKLPVIATDIVGNELEFESIMDASKNLNIRRVTITHCLKGRQKTSGGYKWKYKVIGVTD